MMGDDSVTRRTNGHHQPGHQRSHNNQDNSFWPNSATYTECATQNSSYGSIWALLSMWAITEPPFQVITPSFPSCSPLKGGGKLWATLKCGLIDTSVQINGSLKMWPNCSEWSSYKDYTINFHYNIWFLANKVGQREKRATSDLQRTIFNPVTPTTAGKLDSSEHQQQQLVRLYQKSDFERERPCCYWQVFWKVQECRAEWK